MEIKGHTHMDDSRPLKQRPKIRIRISGLCFINTIGITHNTVGF